MDSEDKIIVYTDGACCKNPGPGGWAVMFEYYTSEGRKKQVFRSGRMKHTTNNQMELVAAIEAVGYILQHICFSGSDAILEAYEIRSDSAYVVDTINYGRYKKWKQDEWHTAAGHEVKNRDLWCEMAFMLGFMSRLKVDLKFVKVKGHSNVEGNNKVDKLAVSEAQAMRESLEKKKKKRS